MEGTSAISAERSSAWAPTKRAVFETKSCWVKPNACLAHHRSSARRTARVRWSSAIVLRLRSTRERNRWRRNMYVRLPACPPAAVCPACKSECGGGPRRHERRGCRRNVRRKPRRLHVQLSRLRARNRLPGLREPRQCETTTSGMAVDERPSISEMFGDGSMIFGGQLDARVVGNQR